MKTVEAYITSKQTALKSHPFFLRLAQLPDIQSLLNIAPTMAFWVMAFQDILRLNEPQVKDPYLLKVARHHRLEDAGHQQWFLQDIGTENEARCGIRQLFSPKDTIIRDAAYAIVAEVFRAGDDQARITLPLVLESAGHVFFGHMSVLSVKSNTEGRLKYFSKSHMDVEAAHEIFETEMERKVYEAVLPPEKQFAIKGMVDRCYTAFNAMFDYLLVHLDLDIQARGVILAEPTQETRGYNP